MLVVRLADGSPPGIGQRLGCGLQPPADSVLDLLGRVRLGEHLREEELQEPAVVAQPVTGVVLGPARSLSSASSNRLAKGSLAGENGASGVVGQMKIWPATRSGLAAARCSA